MISDFSACCIRPLLLIQVLGKGTGHKAKGRHGICASPSLLPRSSTELRVQCGLSSTELSAEKPSFRETAPSTGCQSPCLLL